MKKCNKKTFQGYSCHVIGYENFSKKQIRNHRLEHEEKELLYRNYWYKNHLTKNKNINKRKIKKSTLNIWIKWKKTVEDFFNNEIYL